MNQTVLQFAIQLFSALLLGALVGLKRQWRQRMAGTRTNALVAAGASAFVMVGTLLVTTRVAAWPPTSYPAWVFSVQGVIFKDGGNVRGLNTAATIWCSAAMGVLCGLNQLLLALLVGLAVVFANTVLRPLAYRLHPVLPAAEPSETFYEIVLGCRTTDETHLRTLLVTTISQSPASLQAIHSEDEENSDRTRLRAENVMPARLNDLAERIALRLSMEPSVTSLSWSVVPTAME